MKTITKPSKYEHLVFSATCDFCKTEYTYGFTDVNRQEVFDTNSGMLQYNPNKVKTHRTYTKCPTCHEDVPHSYKNEVKTDPISELTEKA